MRVLLDAAARLRGAWRLLIVGGGAEESALRERAARLGIAGQVEFAPMAPSHDVPGWLQRFDVLAVPSLTTPTWKEQFGRVIIEAMASAVPVVGSDSGEIPHVIADAGMIVPEGDPDALAGALQTLLDDETCRQRLATAGRTRVLAHYTWERIARQYLAVYEQMCASSI